MSKRLVGSYVGNRQDATEALDIAASGKVKTHYKTLPMSALPQVYDDMSVSLPSTSDHAYLLEQAQGQDHWSYRIGHDQGRIGGLLDSLGITQIV